MKLVKLLATFVLFMAFSVGAYAQKNYVKDADKAFSAKQYYNAIDLYKKAMAKIKKKEEKARCTYQVAQCYRAMNDWKQAESWYAKAIKAKYTDDKAILYLAEAKKVNQKYDEAITTFQDYKKAVPSDPAGENGIKSSELAQKWKDSPTRWKVENVAQVNSKEYDFSPMYSDKKHMSIVFTSKREGQTSSKIDPNSGIMYSDIFESKVDKNGKWSAPAVVSGGVNSPANEGACVINKKADKMYFTRCGEVKKKMVTCKIYMAERKGNAWGDAIMIDFGIPAEQLDSFNFRHPTLVADELAMVFSSDMQQGNIGAGSNPMTSDLWISNYDKKTKKWGTPRNLGPGINTTGPEGFPFVREDGTLYFSSSGHLGMGGLDIFSAQRSSADKWEWKNVENLKYPLNSNGDDFGIIFDGKKDRGFLTSNREGTKGADDIWQFYLPPLVFNLDGVVLDCKYKVPVTKAVVRLIGSDGTAVEEKTDAAGYYKFKLLPNVSYVVAVLSDSARSTKAEYYLNLPDKEKGKLTTVGEDNSKDYKQDFCLTPAEREIKFPAVLYDLAKANLRPESKDSLNFLYQTLMDNPTIVIELMSHTDARASDAYNIKLSQARAQACVDYLVKEKNIPAARLKAKGYGETSPLRFPDGTVLTEKYINSFKVKQEQERLHQFNRRTVFRVIGWDYVDPNAPKIDRRVIKPKVIDSFWGDTDISDSTATDTPEPGTGGGTTGTTGATGAGAGTGGTAPKAGATGATGTTPKTGGTGPKKPN
ncbi:MAG: outer membrane protein/peptidoglycan-associated (lipo)protein [Bacteroidetes bacterium]|nr:MAG: outer membrane protein/peptidoglycan-associated (lipo)protein [Bacteroidota bacterium]